MFACVFFFPESTPINLTRNLAQSKYFCFWVSFHSNQSFFPLC